MNYIYLKPYNDKTSTCLAIFASYDDKSSSYKGVTGKRWDIDLNNENPLT